MEGRSKIRSTINTPATGINIIDKYQRKVSKASKIFNSAAMTPTAPKIIVSHFVFNLGKVAFVLKTVLYKFNEFKTQVPAITIMNAQIPRFTSSISSKITSVRVTPSASKYPSKTPALTAANPAVAITKIPTIR